MAQSLSAAPDARMLYSDLSMMVVFSSQTVTDRVQTMMLVIGKLARVNNLVQPVHLMPTCAAAAAASGNLLCLLRVCASFQRFVINRNAPYVCQTLLTSPIHYPLISMIRFPLLAFPFSYFPSLLFDRSCRQPDPILFLLCVAKMLFRGLRSPPCGGSLTLAYSQFPLFQPVRTATERLRSYRGVALQRC